MFTKQNTPFVLTLSLMDFTKHFFKAITSVPAQEIKSHLLFISCRRAQMLILWQNMATFSSFQITQKPLKLHQLNFYPLLVTKYNL
jgi:hypothetical protein